MTSQGWQKRVDRHKESANANLTSWFLKTFSSGKKTQFLRDHDEQSAQLHARRPATTAQPARALGQLSAVANAASGGGAWRGDNERRTPQRQKSFLRQQLLEMKRASAETLLRAQQQRMDGQITEEQLDALDRENRFSDDEEEDFDSDDESVHEMDEAMGDLRLSIDPAASTSSMASTATASTATTVNRSHRSSSATSTGSAAGRRSKKLSRRSSSARSEEAKDAEIAEAEQRAEYSMEVSRRLSQATQLYAEAIYALDSALNPSEARQPMPEPRPLMIGSKNSAKSEWI